MNVESGYSDFAEDVEGERQITVETKPIPGIPNQSGTLFIGGKVIEIKEVPKISTDPSALPIINVAAEDVTDMTNDVSNESSWGTPWTGNKITAVKILNTHPSVSVMAAPMSISQNVPMVLKDTNGFEKKELRKQSLERMTIPIIHVAPENVINVARDVSKHGTKTTSRILSANVASLVGECILETSLTTNETTAMEIDVEATVPSLCVNMATMMISQNDATAPHGSCGNAKVLEPQHYSGNIPGT